MTIDVYSPLLLDAFKLENCPPSLKKIYTSTNTFSKYSEELTVVNEGATIKVFLPSSLPLSEQPITYNASEVERIKYSGVFYYVLPICLLVRNSNGNAYLITTFLQVPNYEPQNVIPPGQLAMF
jgi:hypothetical protein